MSARHQSAEISINVSKIQNILGMKGVDDERLQQMVQHAVVNELNEKLGVDIRLDDIEVSPVKDGPTSKLEGRMQFSDLDETGIEIDEYSAETEEIPYQVAVNERDRTMEIISNPGRAELQTRLEVDLLKGGGINMKVFGPSDQLLSNLVQKGNVLVFKEGKFADMDISSTHNNCMVITTSSRSPDPVLTLIDRTPGLLSDDLTPRAALPDVTHENAEEIELTPVPEGPKNAPGGSFSP